MRNAHLATPLNSRNHDVYGYGNAPIVDPNAKVIDRSEDEAAVAHLIVQMAASWEEAEQLALMLGLSEVMHRVTAVTA